MREMQPHRRRPGRQLDATTEFSLGFSFISLYCSLEKKRSTFVAAFNKNASITAAKIIPDVRIGGRK